MKDNDFDFKDLFSKIPHSSKLVDDDSKLTLLGALFVCFGTLKLLGLIRDDDED